MNKFVISAKREQIKEAIEFIEEGLSKRRIGKSDRVKASLAAEDILTKLIEKSSGEVPVTVEISGLLGSCSLRFRCEGEAFEATDITDNLYFESGTDEDGSGRDDEADATIKHLIEKVFGDKLSITHKKDINIVIYRIAQSANRQIVQTLCALLLGMGAGYLLQTACPGEVSGALSDYVFVPVYTVFMNALKMIVGPLVFCSIGASIADFGDLKTLGKAAGKVMTMYFATSVIAIFVAFFVYQIFPIGDPSLAAAVDSSAGEVISNVQNTSVSIIGTITNAIPSDIVSPFLKSDMLQIIVMAVILGAAASAVSGMNPGLKNALSLMNEVCSVITAKLMMFMPLVVFCAMAKMMIGMELKYLGRVLLWIPVNCAGLLAMAVIYMILLLVLGRVNPLKFMRKFFRATATAITLASSNAALPTSVKCCDDMGISRKIYSFSLPLGATINMDGTCVMLVISTMYLAKIFGVNMGSGMLVSIFVSIFVLSVGAPGVTGSALISLTLLVQQIGLPADSVSLIMGLYPLVSMMITGTNVTGDAVVTTIVSKSNGLLDMDKYNS